MDHYKTLGINKNATQDEIKRAYRKLAMKHHPDRGGNSEQFKKINEAYDTLKDVTKRQQYDNPQRQQSFRSQNFSQQQNPFAGSPFEDLFGGFKSGSTQRFKSPDITVRAIVDLKDIISGKMETVQYRLRNGHIETVKVEIPAGARQGDTIKYNGLGEIGDPRIPRGDLYVKIHIREPKGWARDANNLVIKREVDVFDIMLGCVILIETLDGKRINLNVPRGTNPGTILSISEYGIPDLRSKKRGNLYVQIETNIPKIMDQEILSKIKELQKIVKEKHKW